MPDGVSQSLYPKARRKSSFFRPTSFYPVQLEGDTDDNNHLKIYKLPLSILLEICSFLSASDLLNVCVSSKQLYLPAVLKLYERIIVVKDQNAVDAIRSRHSPIRGKLGTLIATNKLKHLFNTLKCSPKLRSNVKSLRFLDSGIPWFEKVDNIHLSEIFERIIKKSNINDLAFSKVPLLPIGEVFKDKLFMIRRLTIPLDSLDLNLFPSLTELNLVYSNDIQSTKRFTSLASQMLHNLSTLDTLTFALDTTTMDSLNYLNTFNLNSPQASWISFFEGLKVSQTRLHIRNLGLDGFIGRLGIEISALLRDTLELDCIQGLSLDIKEITHHLETHIDSKNSLLSNLTRYTRNLANLYLKPTYNCLSCQHSSVVESLECNLAQKLTTFVLVFESPNITYTSVLQEVIINSQANLKNLSLYDKSREVSDKLKLKKYVGDLEASIYEHAVFYEREWLPISSVNPFRGLSSYSINDYMEQFLNEAHKELSKFLHDFEDSSTVTFKSYIERLPMLEFLSIFNILITVRQGIAYYIANENLILV